jgi:hypothetical protein
MGYLRLSDSIFQVLWMGYRFANPFSVFRNLNINFNQWSGWDFGGTRNFVGTNININGQFTNYWFFNLGTNINGNGIDNSFLRGGPSFKSPGGYNYFLNLSSDNRKHFSFGGNHSQYWSFGNVDNNQNYGVFARYQPVNALRIFFRPGFSTRRSTLQYLTTTKYLGENRYIFSSIRQQTVSATFRIDYTLSQDFTIQYYGSPFISSGDYYDAKVITNPKAENFIDRYSSDVPLINNTYETSYDFNFRQFRSNLVLRWEYRPGSLLYLVWNQGITDFENTGLFSIADDFDSLFSQLPYNVFLIKFSYLLGN